MRDRILERERTSKVRVHAIEAPSVQLKPTRAHDTRLWRDQTLRQRGASGHELEDRPGMHGLVEARCQIAGDYLAAGPPQTRPRCVPQGVSWQIRVRTIVR